MNKMKLGLKDKIQKIVDAYKANMTSQQDEIKGIIDPFKVPSYESRFTFDGLKETIKEQLDVVNGNWKKFDKTLNQQVKEVIAAARDSFKKALALEKTSQKPADYATRIANAREFLKDELEDYTADTIFSDKEAAKLDETMHIILKDFIDDCDTMKLFKKMVQRKAFNFINSDGGCIFPKTFGKLHKVESIMNTLDEMDATAEMLFLHERDIQNYFAIRGLFYGFPVDRYAEGVDEQTMIDCSVILDDLADHLDSEGQSSVSDTSVQEVTDSLFNMN